MRNLKTIIKEKIGKAKIRKSRPYRAGDNSGSVIASFFVNMAAAVIATAFLTGSISSYEAHRNEPTSVSCVQYSESRTVIPCGTPFGLKMLTSGVVVTDFGAVNGRISQLSPAQAAGIQKGDIITEVNGVEINDSAALSEAVQRSPTGCEVCVERNGRELSFRVDALLSEAGGEYKLGMWTKDSVAGIGTMTFYDPETGVFGGLGHGVSDSATGVIMPLKSGEITAVTITDIIKGTNGAPGELCGAFISDTRTGEITVNSDHGVFGVCPVSPVLNDPVEIAPKREVKPGKAVIYSTIMGMIPEEYEIEIVSIDTSESSPTKNMTVRITDERLLSGTGGIVQGMSGSPIIQNGRLIGAVTHVLVNDAAMGYAVFAENMLEAYEKALGDG